MPTVVWDDANETTLWAHWYQDGVDHYHRFTQGAYDPKAEIKCYGCNQLWELLLWQLERKR